MIGFLDTIALLGYIVACAVLVHALLTRRNRVLRPARQYTLGAMGIMAVVSIGNGLLSFGVADNMHNLEEYGEVMFLPLLAYMMHSLYVHSLSARAEKEKAVVAQLDNRLSVSMAEMDEHRLGMLQALGAAVDARDHYTAQHSLHVADYACAIGYRLGMKDRLLHFEQAGLLHDIGKIGIADAILLKNGSLTAEEYDTIQQHADGSARIIETIPFLSEVVEIVRHHHERWDGTGYPNGLKGEQIPRTARVLAVADAFDAMTTDRPYRPAMSVDEARKTLLEGRGKQWDPAPVDTLLALLDEGIVVVESQGLAA